MRTSSANVGRAGATHLERVKVSAILSCIRHSRATDARDKIFALYGILKHAGSEMQAPDYGKSISQVYTETTRCALQKEVMFQQFRMMNVSPLNCIFNIASWNRRKDLPSWVPDWGDADAVTPRLGLLHRWKAAGTSKPELVMSNQGDYLRIKGIQVCKISKKFGVDHNDFAKLDALLTDELVGYLRASTLDSLVFTAHLRQWISAVAELPSISGSSDIMGAFLEMLGIFCQNTSLDTEPSDKIPGQLQQFHEWFNLLALPDDLIVQHFIKSTNSDASSITSELLAALAYENFGVYCMKRNRAELADSINGFMTVLNNYSLFLTDDGHTGVAHAPSKEGDAIILLQGSPLPFVARKNEDDSYCLVAPAFVYKYMDGEKWNDGKLSGMITIR